MRSNKIDWKFGSNIFLQIFLSFVPLQLLLVFISYFSELPCHIHVYLALVTIIIALILVLFWKKYHVYGIYKITDLVPYIIEERKVRKEYKNNSIFFEISEIITIKEIIKFSIPYSITFMKSSGKNSFDPKIAIAGVRKNKPISLRENEHYTVAKQPDNEKGCCDIYIDMKEEFIQKNDSYTITVSSETAINDTNSINYINSSAANTYGIKKLILEWEFPKDKDFDKIVFEVINKYVSRVNGNDAFCKYYIQKEIKRINRKNHNKKNTYESKDQLTIKKPIYGLTYRSRGEVTPSYCRIE